MGYYLATKQTDEILNMLHGHTLKLLFFLTFASLYFHVYDCFVCMFAYHVPVCMSCMYLVPMKARRGHQIHESRFTVVCELPCRRLGIELKSSGRAGGALNS